MIFEVPYFLAFFYNIQGGQLFIIIVAILLLFGAKRLPDVAKSLGKAFNEFRKAASDVSKDIQPTIQAAQAPLAQEPSKNESAGATPLDSAAVKEATPEEAKV